MSNKSTQLISLLLKFLQKFQKSHIQSTSKDYDPSKVPDPIMFPERFYNYIKENNVIVTENKHWILIVNKYIPNQLVCFAKMSKSRFLTDLNNEEFASLQEILSKYRSKTLYINADTEKSIPNRFHIHVKLTQPENKNLQNKQIFNQKNIN